MPLDRQQIVGALGNGCDRVRQMPVIPVRERQKKLRAFKKLLYARKQEIFQAAAGDLWRNTGETLTAELLPLLHITGFLADKLPALAAGYRIPDSRWTFPSFSRAVPEPYGLVLAVSSWNYPFLLALEPALGAYAAGNRVVLKLARRAPRVMHLLTTLVSEIFSTEEIMPIGDELHLAELLQYRFDYIFFTGSDRIGKQVMSAAGKFLTPLTLELGGKNPCIVAPGADLKSAARRIVWSKFFNAGQTCVAPDYLLVHRDLKGKLLQLLNFYIRRFYSDHPLENYSIPALPDRKAYERICRLISDGRLLIGGDRDPVRFAVEPTVIDQLNDNSPLFQEEIFGPVLPVLEYLSPEELKVQLKKMEKPLALYCFGGSRELRRQLRDETSSGALVFDDAMIHFANIHLPFGGVGRSGMGAYHGRRSFETFSHFKPVMYKPSFPDWPPRYPDSWYMKLLVKLFNRPLPE